MKRTPQIITAACVAALVFCGPSLAFAAAKDKASPSPAASPAEAKSTEKAPRATGFRGTATEVNKSAKTFTVAGVLKSRVFKVTDKTTVTKKDGSAAKFSDLSNNTAVTGSYWKHDDGTLEAKTLKIGDAAAAPQESAKKSDAAASPSPAEKKK